MIISPAHSALFSLTPICGTICREIALVPWFVVTLPMGFFIVYIESAVIYLCNNTVQISTDF